MPRRVPVARVVRRRCDGARVGMRCGVRGRVGDGRRRRCRGGVVGARTRAGGGAGLVGGTRGIGHGARGLVLIEGMRYRGRCLSQQAIPFRGEAITGSPKPSGWPRGALNFQRTPVSVCGWTALKFRALVHRGRGITCARRSRDASGVIALREWLSADDANRRCRGAVLAPPE